MSSQPLYVLDQHQPQPIEVLQQQYETGGPPINLTCVSESILYWSKGPPFRIIVGLACCFSAIGALLIIFSYACFRSLRSRARLVLVHLSLMDFGVSVMNLLGNLVYFDGYYIDRIPAANAVFPDQGEVINTNSVCQVYHLPKLNAIQHLCTAQAFLAHYFTYCSVLWTINLAVFIYLIIVHHRSSYIKISLRISYFLCYGIPILLCLWLLFTDRFGYSPANGLWCSIMLHKPGEPRADTYAAFFGYDLWIYLAFIVVPIYFIAVKLFIREKIRQTKLFLPEAETRFWEALYILDYKFLLIPLCFFFLRIWACVQVLIQYYIDAQLPTTVDIVLNYLSSIGNSSQGFANAILFVLFTKKVRRTVFNLSYWRKIWRRKIRNETSDTPSSSDGNINPMESEILTPSKFTESLTRSYIEHKPRPISTTIN